MSDETDERVALWWWSHGSIHVTVCESEAVAAKTALDFYDYDDMDGAPEGVQFPDGRFLKANSNDWPEYAAEDQRRWERIRAKFDEERRNPKPKPATRTVRAPFDTTKTVVVDGDAPDWLGA